MTDAGRSRLLGQHCAGEGQSRLLWAGWRLKWRRGLWPPVGERTLDWLRGVIDLPPLMMVETLLWATMYVYCSTSPPFTAGRRSTARPNRAILSWFITYIPIPGDGASRACHKKNSNSAWDDSGLGRGAETCACQALRSSCFPLSGIPLSCRSKIPSVKHRAPPPAAGRSAAAIAMAPSRPKLVLPLAHT
jgi:hypothetical protein